MGRQEHQIREVAPTYDSSRVGCCCMLPAIDGIVQYKKKNLKQVNSIKYLGINCDSKMTFRDHINYVGGKKTPWP